MRLSKLHMRRDRKNRGISGNVAALCGQRMYAGMMPVTTGKRDKVECWRCIDLLNKEVSDVA